MNNLADEVATYRWRKRIFRVASEIVKSCLIHKRSGCAHVRLNAHASTSREKVSTLECVNERRREGNKIRREEGFKGAFVKSGRSCCVQKLRTILSDLYTYIYIYIYIYKKYIHIYI